MQNFFELFSLTVDFDIDLSKLELAYQQQAGIFHPDKFATATEKEKNLALQNTSLVNTAYDTLKSPLLRATYLLELAGINAFDEKDTQMDTAFLMAQIELRESLEVIKVEQQEIALDDFIENITGKIKHNIAQIQQKFEFSEFNEIKNLVRELKFYIQLEGQAKQLMDEWL